MSYIGMELDAFNSCPDVGDACGLTAAQICHGLMRMWVHVFRAEQDVLDTIQIQGFMYGNERASRALVVFGFLERVNTDAFRVKGSKRLLGLRAARRKGGEAAKTNLVPGAFHRRKAAEGLAHGPAEHIADGQPNKPIGYPSALTPTTDYRLPTTKKEERELERASATEKLGAQMVKALEVYAHYRETFHRRQPEPTAEEKDHILGRVRDGYEVSELCKAISGLKNSEWHRQRGFNALSYALGSRDVVERCLVWAGTPPDAPASAPTQSVNTCFRCGDGATCKDWEGNWICYPCLDVKTAEADAAELKKPENEVRRG